VGDVVSFKAGDRVAVMDGFGRGVARIAVVERVTSLHAIVGGEKYRLNGGSAVKGDAWCRRRIVLATVEHVEAIKRKQLTSIIGRINPEKLSIDTLEKIAAIVESDR
jgi:hypothetical protein